MSIATRTDDETVLAWLALRDRSVDTLNIAKRYGTTSERIRTATNRVRAQDIAADPAARASRKRRGGPASRVCILPRGWRAQMRRAA